jgi:hypothetical protein
VLDADFVDSLFQETDEAANGKAQGPGSGPGFQAAPSMPPQARVAGHAWAGLLDRDLLRAAQQEIRAGISTRAQFAEQRGISPRQLRIYIDADGNLTETGLQAMLRSSDDVPTSAITKELLLQAESLVRYGRREMTLTLFALAYNVDLYALKKYINTDGTFTQQGHILAESSHVPDDLPELAPAQADALAVPEPGCSPRERRRFIEAMAARLEQAEHWDFPGADDAFAMAFKHLAFYYNIRIALHRGPGPTMFGPLKAAEAGTVLVRNGRYAVRLAGYDYEHYVPQDGDRAFHAINALHLHAQGKLFKHYREERSDANGNDPLWRAGHLVPRSAHARTRARLIRLVTAGLYRHAMEKIRDPGETGLAAPSTSQADGARTAAR